MKLAFTEEAEFVTSWYVNESGDGIWFPLVHVLVLKFKSKSEEQAGKFIN